MCVIILCEKESAFPSLATLESAEKLNPHGGGIAWLENGKVRYKKGINAKEIFAITEKIQLPAIIHFRIASIGSVVTELCHPFQINDEASTDIEGTCDGVLFHNGTWSEWNEFMMKAVISSNSPMPIGQWSDSRAMAWLANKYGSKFLQLIDTSNKIAVLTPSGIEKFGRYVEVEKNLCSNDYFEDRDYGTFSNLYKSSNSNFNFNKTETKEGESIVMQNVVDGVVDEKPLSKRQRKKERKRKEKEDRQRKLDESATKSVAKEIVDNNKNFITEQKKDGYILTVKDQLKSKEMDSAVDTTEIFDNDSEFEKDYKMLQVERKAVNERRLKEAQDEQDEVTRPVRSRYFGGTTATEKRDFYDYYR